MFLFLGFNFGTFYQKRTTIGWVSVAEWTNRYFPRRSTRMATPIFRLRATVSFAFVVRAISPWRRSGSSVRSFHLNLFVLLSTDFSCFVYFQGPWRCRLQRRQRSRLFRLIKRKWQFPSFLHPVRRSSFRFHFFLPFFSSRLEAKGRDEMMNTPLHVDGTENASKLFLFFLKLKKKKSAASTRLSLLNTSKGDWW